jgi:hypothetical protein
VAHLAGIAAPEMNEPLDYHAFVIGPDGHVRLRYDLICASEAEAREKAKQLLMATT